MLTHLTHTCPKGGAILIAADRASLDRKIETHELIAHGARPITPCRAPLAAGHNAHARPVATGRGYSLSGRAI